MSSTSNMPLQFTYSMQAHTHTQAHVSPRWPECTLHTVTRTRWCVVCANGREMEWEERATDWRQKWKRACVIVSAKIIKYIRLYVMWRSQLTHTNNTENAVRRRWHRREYIGMIERKEPSTWHAHYIRHRRRQRLRRPIDRFDSIRYNNKYFERGK